jgi:hypothetical protein
MLALADATCPSNNGYGTVRTEASVVKPCADIHAKIRPQAKEDGYETTEWLNFMLESAWPAMEPIWAENLRSSLDSVLQPRKPKYLV